MGERTEEIGGNQGEEGDRGKDSIAMSGEMRESDAGVLVE